MSLSNYLEYGSHLARLHRRRRRRAYAPTTNTASHDNHEKINSWVSFCFPYEYGAPLGGPSELRYKNASYLRSRLRGTRYAVSNICKGKSESIACVVRLFRLMD